MIPKEIKILYSSCTSRAGTMRGRDSRLVVITRLLADVHGRAYWIDEAISRISFRGLSAIIKYIDPSISL